jgi:hypothetical protein
VTNRANQNWPDGTTVEIESPETIYEFEANGKRYSCDQDTAQLLRYYRAKNNRYMLGAVLTIGLDFGRIVELS